MRDVPETGPMPPHPPASLYPEIDCDPETSLHAAPRAEEGSSLRGPGLLAGFLAGVAALPFVYRGITGRWPFAAGERGGRPAEVSARLTVARSPEEAYHAWRDLERLPHLLSHIERVEVLDPLRSRWTATTPAGGSLTWEAEIVRDEPGRLLAWRSLPGSTVEHRGRIEFLAAPAGRGTVVTAVIGVEDGKGLPGSAVAAGVTERALEEDLRRFKRWIESGEAARAASLASGERSNS